MREGVSAIERPICWRRHTQTAEITVLKGAEPRGALTEGWLWFQFHVATLPQPTTSNSLTHFSTDWAKWISKVKAVLTCISSQLFSLAILQQSSFGLSNTEAPTPLVRASWTRPDRYAAMFSIQVNFWAMPWFALQHLLLWDKIKSTQSIGARMSVWKSWSQKNLLRHQYSALEL